MARIGTQRGFVTGLADETMHMIIIKALKSKNVKINNTGYTFIGDYSLPEHRHGKNDSRAATGTLKENGLMYSLGGC